MSKLIETAPRHIYLQISYDKAHYAAPFPLGSEISWCDEAVMECEVDYVRKDIADGLRDALDAALSMIEHSLAGLVNPDTGKIYRRGVDDLALTPDGKMTLLKGRAILAKSRGES